jgi:hypothetical protein
MYGKWVTLERKMIRNRPRRLNNFNLWRRKKINNKKTKQEELGRTVLDT